jgi:hypothetical protein
MPDRTTVVLPASLKERAVAQAREQKISFGEFVRRAVEKQLATPPRGKSRKTGDPFWDNLVAYDDDAPADLSVRHDEYLYGSKR